MENSDSLRAKIDTLNSDISEIQLIVNPLKSEKVQLMNKIKILETDIKNYDNLIANKKKEIVNATNLLLIESAYDEVKQIKNIELLSEAELIIITKNMDKTDYTKRGSYPRFIDLDRLINEVITIKTKYPGFILDNIRKRGQLDTMPPENYYDFTFVTPHNDYFTISGIQVC